MLNKSSSSQIQKQCVCDERKLNQNGDKCEFFHRFDQDQCSSCKEIENNNDFKCKCCKKIVKQIQKCNICFQFVAEEFKENIYQNYICSQCTNQQCKDCCGKLIKQPPICNICKQQTFYLYCSKHEGFLKQNEIIDGCKICKFLDEKKATQDNFNNEESQQQEKIKQREQQIQDTRVQIKNIQNQKVVQYKQSLQTIQDLDKQILERERQFIDLQNNKTNEFLTLKKQNLEQFLFFNLTEDQKKEVKNLLQSSNLIQKIDQLKQQLENKNKLTKFETNHENNNNNQLLKSQNLAFNISRTPRHQEQLQLQNKLNNNQLSLQSQLKAPISNSNNSKIKVVISSKSISNTVLTSFANIVLQ